MDLLVLIVIASAIFIHSHGYYYYDPFVLKRCYKVVTRPSKIYMCNRRTRPTRCTWQMVYIPGLYQVCCPNYYTSRDQNNCVDCSRMRSLEHRVEIIQMTVSQKDHVVCNQTSTKGNVGPVGQKGNSGLVGDEGGKGSNGRPGLKGVKGDRGLQGEKGERGVRGFNGQKGNTGIRGPRGEIGPAGQKGTPGLTGPRGPPGLLGQKGWKGDKGTPASITEEMVQDVLTKIEKVNGRKGETGERGPKGPRGPPGRTGASGMPGVVGMKGEPGSKGDMGPPGEPGVLGEPGKDGSNGINGRPGEMGQKGQRGIRGYIGYPGSPGKDGSPGEQGLRGVPGLKGEPADLNTVEYVTRDEIKALENRIKTLETMLGSCCHPFEEIKNTPKPINVTTTTTITTESTEQQDEIVTDKTATYYPTLRPPAGLDATTTPSGLDSEERLNCTGQVDMKLLKNLPFKPPPLPTSGELRKQLLNQLNGKSNCNKDTICFALTYYKQFA